MQLVPLKDVAVGAEFVKDGISYVRINPEKISCCRSYVAVLKDNPQQKVVLNLNLKVEIND